MKKISYITLLLGMAGSLTAQTLSFGEITLVTPATTPPSYVVNVVLRTAGTANAGLVAGLQFDLNYNVSQLSVTMAAAGTALTASKELSSTTLPAANNPSTGAPVNNLPGQRAIITGVGLSDASVSATGGPSTITDGVVATLTIQPIGVATSSNETVTLLNLAATSAGALNVAAVSIPLAVGAGNSDPGGTGTTNLYSTYLVGDVNTPGSAYPPASESAPNFGTAGKLNIADLILMLQVATNAPGFSAPPTCSDLFDAMDAAPADTATVRGGDGLIKLADLIIILQRATNAPGFTIWPVRTSRNEVCTSSASHTAMAVRPAEIEGTIVLGAPEGAGTGQDRVPVYVQGGRDLAQLAVGFSVGDEQSQLRFVAADTAPSLLQEAQAGIISAAWLGGLNVRAGQRLLLGYVVGPAGSAANLKVFGVSAAGLGDNREVGLDVSGARFDRK